MPAPKDDKYEKHRAALREERNRDEEIWMFRETLKELREDSNFTAEQAQAVYAAAAKIMTYEDPMKVDQDLEKATNAEIWQATEHILDARESMRRASIGRAGLTMPRHDKEN